MCRIRATETCPEKIRIAASLLAKCPLLQRVPNITELFKKFTELMLGRWDEGKGLRQQYQAPLKDFVLTRLAFYMHSSHIVSIAKSEAARIVGEELVKRGYAENVQDLLEEIFQRSGIFRVTAHDVEFRHHLLQEFFAGRGISEPDAVHQLIHDEWWKRALVFYFGERAENISLLASAAKSTNGIEPGKLVEAATTVGLALQACYLSPVEEKLNVWKWVVEALEISQTPAIQAADADNKYPMSSFFHFYLYARDSVALSHLRSNIKDLGEWADKSSLVGSDGGENHIYWLIIGLIESGDISVAESIIAKYRPKDSRLLTAIHLGCHLAKEIRPIPDAERAAAKRVCELLLPRVRDDVIQIHKEMGSLLLEMRNGKVASLKDAPEAENDEKHH